jgi:hypothetical protein
MKQNFQITAFLVLVLMSLVPAHASATKTPDGARTHSQTYHNRTPTAHTHGTQAHHRG